MNDPQMETQYPYWLTLGGDSGRYATNSDWLAWTTFTLCFCLFVTCMMISRVWFREAMKSKTEIGRKAKANLAWMYCVGGFSAFGVRCLMLWVPAWSFFLLSLAATLVSMVVFLVRVRNINIVFARADVAENLRLELRSLAHRSPVLSPTVVREELVRLCNVLDLINKKDDGSL